MFAEEITCDIYIGSDVKQHRPDQRMHFDQPTITHPGSSSKRFGLDRGNIEKAHTGPKTVQST